MKSEENIGFSTSTALLKLHEDIEKILLIYELKIHTEGIIKKLKIFFHDRTSLDSPLDTFNVVSTLISIAALIFCCYYKTAFAVLLLLIVNLLVVVRENILKRTEIFRKVRGILDEIKLASKLCKEWNSSNFPHLCSPVSPCVTLQWCYRDGEIVNLPYALLVQGDHIVMRPGQVAPAPCKELNGSRRFQSGETYGLTQPSDPPLKPVARAPLPDLICLLEVSPYIENLQISLDKFLERPTTIHNEQRHLMITKLMHRYLFLIILTVVVITAVLRITGIFITGKVPISWQNIFIRNSVAALLPILPLMFPVLWISINLWGIARLETLLAIPQPLMRMEGKKSELDLDLDTPQCDMDEVYLPRKQVFMNWWSLLNGSCDLLGRSANIVQVLGSITALCVVDKKGILSWPNPTAEKVFFLRDSSDDTSDNSSECSINSNSTHNNKNEIIPEVLDLTHDQHSPFKLEFDDTEWKNHLASLKPLGLAILCNTCCPETQLHYTKFCGHITSSAILSKHLIPALNRFVILEESLKSFMHG